MYLRRDDFIWEMLEGEYVLEIGLYRDIKFWLVFWEYIYNKDFNFLKFEYCLVKVYMEKFIDIKKYIYIENFIDLDFLFREKGLGRGREREIN